MGGRLGVVRVRELRVGVRVRLGLGLGIGLTTDLARSARQPYRSTGVRGCRRDTQERELTFLDFDCQRRLRNCSRRNSWTLKSLKSREKPFQNSLISWFQSSLSKSTLGSLHSETRAVTSFASKSTKVAEAEHPYRSRESFSKLK